MNSLEFIEKEIEKEQAIIKTYEEYFKTDKTELDKQITRGYIQIHQKNIDHLNHIKTILEVWEVIKPGIYKRKLGEERYIQIMPGVFNEGECCTSGINPYEIIKKALEVKDE